MLNKPSGENIKWRYQLPRENVFFHWFAKSDSDFCSRFQFYSENEHGWLYVMLESLLLWEESLKCYSCIRKWIFGIIVTPFPEKKNSEKKHRDGFAKHVSKKLCFENENKKIKTKKQNLNEKNQIFLKVQQRNKFPHL